MKANGVAKGGKGGGKGVKKNEEVRYGEWKGKKERSVTGMGRDGRGGQGTPFDLSTARGTMPTVRRRRRNVHRFPRMFTVISEHICFLLLVFLFLHFLVVGSVR